MFPSVFLHPADQPQQLCLPGAAEQMEQMDRYIKARFDQILYFPDGYARFDLGNGPFHEIGFSESSARTELFIHLFMKEPWVSGTASAQIKSLLYSRDESITF